MLCGRWARKAMVKCCGMIGKGLTRRVKFLSICFCICSLGRFCSHRKHGRLAMLFVSMLAPVDTIRAGLNCSLSVVSPQVSSRVLTFRRSLKCCRASSHSSSCRLKKRCSELSAVVSVQPDANCCRAAISSVRRRSLYRLLAFCRSMLKAASLLPSQRRQRYSSSKIRPMRYLREKASPRA